MNNNDEDIKIYFKRGEWNKMSELEKTRYRNTYNMYRECLMQGIDLPKPDFMVSNKENRSENANKNKSKKKKRISFKFPPKKYPKRKLPLVDYKEEDSPDIDSYIYCDTCEEEFEKFCPKCGMLLHILDNNVRKGTKNRAKKTLPKKLLQIKKSPIHGEGVFALKNIPRGVKFGPYEGLETVESKTGYAWKIRGGKLVDASKIEFSNWMRFVNCARNVDEQNLVAFQYEGGLFYRSVKEIKTGEELLVFYGEEFAEILNIDTRKYFEPVVEREKRDVFACVSCCLGFSSEEYLKKHLFKCPSKILKEMSLKTSVNVFKNMVPCPFCKIYLRDGEYLEKHKKYCSNKSKRCPSKILKETSLKTNVDIFKDMVPCPFCMIYLRDEEYLEKHKKYCSDRFKSLPVSCGGSLAGNNAAIAEKKFKCTMCTYQTDHRSHFNYHTNAHNGIKAFECKICNKRFSTKVALKRHIRLHTGEKPFMCNECNYRGSQKSNLMMHIKNNHSTEKDFSCYYCPQKFITKSHLITHLRIHTGEKPFDCEFCNKKFKQKHHLKNHINIHLNVKFKCPKCNYDSRQKSHLNRHYKKYHPTL